MASADRYGWCDDSDHWSRGPEAAAQQVLHMAVVRFEVPVEPVGDTDSTVWWRTA